MSKRSDAVGIFWQDLPTVKPPKVEKIKRGPPERTWEHLDYLPGLYDALAFDVGILSDQELWAMQSQRLAFDIEIYPNYFFVGFRCPRTNKVACFESSAATNFCIDLPKLHWMIHNFCLVGFNSKNFDLPIVTMALAGKNVEFLHWATQMIIVGDPISGDKSRPGDILRSNKIKKLEVNHIDLIEVSPLSGSLKKYAARLFAKRMQDLPFAPGTVLTADQAAIVRWYCVNSDLPATILLHDALLEQLQLREKMSYEYGIDLRSRSDAQVAEDVIGAEIKKMTGDRPRPPNIFVGTTFYYRPPHDISFQSPFLKWAYSIVKSSPLVVSEFGNINLPQAIADLKLQIANCVYRMGVGGLHSSEKKTTHVADSTYDLIDIDVESFYPRIILNQGLFPKHIGQTFLRVYDTIVQRRLHAKKEAKKCKAAGDKDGEARWKSISDSLKITINGTFGKLGSPYSMIYAPDLLIQVTLSGQLYLLMIIEALELANINVVSANTDGIVCRVPKVAQLTFKNIKQQWENRTRFVLEETNYTMLLSRDVNNYIAIKKEKDGSLSTKNKGVFANPWREKNSIFRMHKNPVHLICVEAIESYLTKHIPIERTVRECKDVTKFVIVRDAKGGGVKIDGDNKTQLFMGKMLRWYYAKDEEGMIVYAPSGNKIVRTDEGAKPIMDLPDTFPEDLNHEWYIEEAEKMLASMGYN